MLKCWFLKQKHAYLNSWVEVYLYVNIAMYLEFAPNLTYIISIIQTIWMTLFAAMKTYMFLPKKRSQHSQCNCKAQSGPHYWDFSVEAHVPSITLATRFALDGTCCIKTTYRKKRNAHHMFRCETSNKHKTKKDINISLWHFVNLFETKTLKTSWISYGMFITCSLQLVVLQSDWFVVWLTVKLNTRR